MRMPLDKFILGLKYVKMEPKEAESSNSGRADERTIRQKRKRTISRDRNPSRNGNYSERECGEFQQMIVSSCMSHLYDRSKERKRINSLNIYYSRNKIARSEKSLSSYSDKRKRYQQMRTSRNRRHLHNEPESIRSNDTILSRGRRARKMD